MEEGAPALPFDVIDSRVHLYFSQHPGIAEDDACVWLSIDRVKGL